MKRLPLIIIALLAVLPPLHAQQETTVDTLSVQRAPESDLLPADTREYGGFLIDMGLMDMSATPSAVPRAAYGMPPIGKDYSRMFSLNPNVVYSQGWSRLFAPEHSFVYSLNPFGWGGFWDSTPQNLQMGSFRLNNGMRINTYGEYTKEGYRVPNRSALPWERNNFKGAFELKSANGSFGIRVEVQQGRGGLW
ncbi:MAG: occludin [Prevotellaceae bacterium]|nr:occludin [Prevotellaceae bacterium]